MRAYEALTAPVVEHYRASGRFAEVDGDQSIEVVMAGIIAALERLRQKCNRRRGFFAQQGQLSAAHASAPRLKTEN
jgi:hypothetical protein